MKISKLKSILFSLMAITLVTVFLSSCEKEESNSILDYDNPSHTKEISIMGINKSKDFQFKFEIAANDEALLESFNNESITMEFLSKDKVDDLVNEEHNTENYSGSQSPEEEGISNRDIFVRIKLTEIIAPQAMSEMLPYELNINPKVNEVIKEMKAITVLDFEQSIPITNIDQPISSRVDFDSYNKRIHLRGDCGVDGTLTKNYWAWTNEPTNEDKVINNTYFKCNRYIAVCCKPNSRFQWVRRVTILQDVLAGYTTISNSCGNFDYCELNADNSCSGYYPNGCWN